MHDQRANGKVPKIEESGAKDHLSHGGETAAASLSQLSKDPAAVALGRRGGLKGGRARAEALSPARRTEIARAAAKARWAGNTDE